MGKFEARQRAREFVDGIKVDSECLDCGEWFPACAMDFDHVVGAKIKNISVLVRNGASLAAIQAEIDKCDLVCACCHRVRTADRRR